MQNPPFCRNLCTHGSTIFKHLVHSLWCMCTPLELSTGMLLFDAALSAWSSWSSAYSQRSTVVTARLSVIVLSSQGPDLFSKQSWLQWLLYKHGTSSSSYIVTARVCVCLRVWFLLGSRATHAHSIPPAVGLSTLSNLFRIHVPKPIMHVCSMLVMAHSLGHNHCTCDTRPGLPHNACIHLVLVRRSLKPHCIQTMKRAIALRCARHTPPLHKATNAPKLWPMQ